MLKQLTKANLLIILIFTLSSVSAYKILGIFSTGGHSHHIFGSSLMKGLARKGHEVTVISPFPLKEPMKNYHDIPLTGINSSLKSTSANLFDLTKVNAFQVTLWLCKMGAALGDTVLSKPEVKAFLQSNQTFDAVICEIFTSDVIYGISDHFGAPLIGLEPFGVHILSTDLVGSPSPPSYVPNIMLHFTDRMTLMQRISNLVFAIFDRIVSDYLYLPQQEALYRKHFPNAKRSLLEVRKNTALVLVNQHVSFNFPRPYMPNHIEVGGMHINRKRNPLPADIQRFIEESRHGVIYFSMGANLKSKDMPKEKLQMILNTFRGLKQRVLWKFEEPNLKGKPENVLISDWFPQNDILAHENVVAFITHGGVLSATESIYHGKPFIGIPIYGDQFLNMARAEANGVGITLNFKQWTTSSFKAAIKRIVTDPKYTQKVRDMSARYRDQPQEPLDRAIFWVEHVARHKGAEYMHCAGLELNFWQYHNIDAMLILYGGVLLVLLLIVLLVRCAVRFLLKALTGGAKKVKKH